MYTIIEYCLILQQKYWYFDNLQCEKLVTKHGSNLIKHSTYIITSVKRMRSVFVQTKHYFIKLNYSSCLQPYYYL